MTTSARRTLVIGGENLLTAREVLLGYPHLWWPTTEPSTSLDYTLNITSFLSDIDDELVSVTLAVAPSGTGELTASDLSVSSGVITCRLAGGYPGRSYVVKVEGVCAGGDSKEWTIGLLVDEDLPITMLPPQCLDYGTALTWALSTNVVEDESGNIGTDNAGNVGTPGQAGNLGLDNTANIGFSS